MVARLPLRLLGLLLLTLVLSVASCQALIHALTSPESFPTTRSGARSVPDPARAAGTVDAATPTAPRPRGGARIARSD